MDQEVLSNRDDLCPHYAFDHHKPAGQAHDRCSMQGRTGRGIIRGHGDPGVDRFSTPIRSKNGAHTPGITAHEGNPGEMPGAAGIMNVMKRVIGMQPMILRAKPALARVEMYPVP